MIVNGRIWALTGLSGGLFAFAQPGLASESIVYAYDALGRLVQVSSSNSNPLYVHYTYDAAGNRTNVTTDNVYDANAGGSSGNSGGATNIGYVVVPLNGYTLIPFTK